MNKNEHKISPCENKPLVSVRVYERAGALGSASGNYSGVPLYFCSVGSSINQRGQAAADGISPNWAWGGGLQPAGHNEPL